MEHVQVQESGALSYLCAAGITRREKKKKTLKKQNAPSVLILFW